MTRTNPATFDLPVEKLRSGYYSDHYFNRTKGVLEDSGYTPDVVIQCFQRADSYAGGVDEAIAILKTCSGIGVANGTEVFDKYPNDGRVSIQWDDRATSPFWLNGWDQLEVKALNEGDKIKPWEPVLQIKGPYHLFAHLETPILGVMARRSLVMRNVKAAVEAANGKPIWFFPARHDHWVVQTGDGMAAHQAGAASVSTHAGASWWGGEGMGTIPHALIAAYGGSTVDAAEAFAKRYGDETNVTVLVDFDNDSVRTALDVAQRLDDVGHKLWGVRLDTSGNLMDEALQFRDDFGQFKATGVVPELVEEVREALDGNGWEDVKIIVSGGFTADKIKSFEDRGTAVDAYGVGSSLLRGSNDYTADVVMFKGTDERDTWQPCAKVGRRMQDDSRLEIVT